MTAMAQSNTLQNVSYRPIAATNSANPPALSSLEDRTAKFECVRSWNIKYDGGKDILHFIDRLEELSGMYEISLESLIPMMFELLTDRALIWFRNNRKPWQQWCLFKTDFLSFFLPPRYVEKLEHDVRSRIQQPQENFKDYLLALQDLMYHSKISSEEKLEIIYRNSLPDYQWYIKRRDFSTLDELLALADELESIPTSKHLGNSERYYSLQDKPSPLPVETPRTIALGRQNIKAKSFARYPAVKIILSQAQSSSPNPCSEKKLESARKRCTPNDGHIRLTNQRNRHYVSDVQKEGLTPKKLRVTDHQRRKVLAENNSKVSIGHMGIGKPLYKPSRKCNQVSRDTRQGETCQSCKSTQHQHATEKQIYTPQSIKTDKGKRKSQWDDLLPEVLLTTDSSKIQSRKKISSSEVETRSRDSVKFYTHKPPRRKFLIPLQSTLMSSRKAYDDPLLDHLPLDAQQQILQRGEASKRTRLRFIHEVRGRLFRVTFTRNGGVLLKLLDKKLKPGGGIV